MKDFADYTVTESAPLTCHYRGYDIISSPPPSSGGASMCEILNILSGYPMDKMPVHSAKSIHLMVEAMRHAYVDRNFSLGDPAFVKNPLDNSCRPSTPPPSAPRSIPSRRRPRAK